MARYVAPGVRAIEEDPTPGESVHLAVVPSNDATEAVKERIRDQNGDVERHLPSGVLVVSLPEPEVAAISQIESLESVSLSDRMETL